MALSGQATFIDNASGDEQPDGVTMRRLVKSLVGVNGFGGATAMKVSQRSAGANMSVDIAAGSAYTEHTDTTDGGYLYDFNDAAFNIAIAAADATNPRKDLVIIHHPDTAFDGSDNVPAFAVVQGTAAGSPVDPDPDDDYENWQTIARIAVAANATSITDANITDLRNVLPYAGRKLQTATLTGGPTSGTTELTVGTVSVPAQPLGYDLTANAFLSMANSVADDTGSMKIKVNATTKGEALHRHLDDSLAGTHNYAITSTPAVAIAAETAATVIVTISRSSGTGTFTVSSSGGLLEVQLNFIHP